MLHGALPRAYLPPGMGYLGGYFEEAQHPQQPYATYAAQQQHLLDGAYWQPAALGELRRAPTPCPLDLSLKPAARPRPAEECEAIEVDDEEDRRGREEARSRPSSEALSPAYHHHLHQPQPQQQHLQALHAPMTPPSTPSPPQCPSRRKPQRGEDEGPRTPPQAPGPTPRAAAGKRKHARRLKFDEDTSSPVSGTVILGPDEAVVTGDIDPAFNVVEVTEEARAELAKIENRLGPYQCKLCRQLHEDAFQLARHRCSRIAHVEYRCPECDKRFSCPANLASHRRWHRPRPPGGPQAAEAGELGCARCGAKFARQAALRKHLAAQHPEEPNNGGGSGGSGGSSNGSNNDDGEAEGEEGKPGAEGCGRRPAQASPPMGAGAPATETA